MTAENCTGLHRSSSICTAVVHGFPTSTQRSIILYLASGAFSLLLYSFNTMCVRLFALGSGDVYKVISYISTISVFVGAIEARKAFLTNSSLFGLHQLA